MDGFAYAGEALSGKYYGAGDRVGLRITVRRLFGFGIIMGLVFYIDVCLRGCRFSPSSHKR